MLEGLLYLALLLLLLLLVLFLILFFIFLFLLCASRLSTRQSKIDRPPGQLAIAAAIDQGKGTRRDAEEAG